MKSKSELLGHYAEKDPNDFIQVDVFDIGVDSRDCVMRPNEHGLCIMSSMTSELMNGGGEDGMRILIGPKMSKEKIKQALLDVLADSDFISGLPAWEEKSNKMLAEEIEKQKIRAAAERDEPTVPSEEEWDDCPPTIN